jgi:uncharacterized peroxidase-related enzyme
VPHIDLPTDVPGLLSLTRRYPGTGEHLFALAQAVLRGPSSLTVAEREIIGTFVSSRNGCGFCTEVHAATAAHLLGDGAAVLESIRGDTGSGIEDPRLAALLVIAGKVVRSGREVTAADIAAAREHGADDQAIHDTVLIAAAFCMYNRYVDGLATNEPADPAQYKDIGRDIAAHGYRSRR